MTNTATRKALLEAELNTLPLVPVVYRKSDEETKAYLLTRLLAPSYEAKTDRVKVETPAHLISAYDQNSGRFVSLKVDNILGKE